MKQKLVFNRREDLADVANRMGYKIGVEVGVQRRIFAASLIEHWGGTLVLVDPWKNLENYKDAANVSDDEHEKAKIETIERCSKFGRFVIVQKTSLDAALCFSLNKPDDKFDFVYIDADHSYEAVKTDITAWYPLVRSGGIIAGHDYVDDGDYPWGSFGVKRAVSELFNVDDVIISKEDGGLAPSWLVVKP